MLVPSGHRRLEVKENISGTVEKSALIILHLKSAGLSLMEKKCARMI
jgi:hypothetical protein